MKIILMGVAGCGKSSVGVALGEAVRLPYRDGDDLHPAENIAKMSRGEALSDADRWPWLALVGQALRAPGIVGCSALKRVYRELIDREAGGGVVFVHLSGSRAVIEGRMRGRTGHFMPPALLDSQFATLEAPAPDERAVVVDIDQPLAAVVAEIGLKLERFGLAAGGSPPDPEDI
ncbi:gluconokinase [Cypionkella sp.]|uniref:gluconokinase n=1 Tax=Cypionkella sp. TaxID=2811411 RepID=UPI002ABB7F6A|nr:gluconokinase [Cypionkella sp.]MDZ4392554.1 gluconokinase [Cypionkella sp.]